MMTTLAFDSREALLAYLEVEDQLSAAQKLGVEWLAFYAGGVLLSTRGNVRWLSYPFSSHELEAAADGG
jgi:hypothetical protein